LGLGALAAILPLRSLNPPQLSAPKRIMEPMGSKGQAHTCSRCGDAARHDAIALFQWEWNMHNHADYHPDRAPISWDEAEQLYQQVMEGVPGTSGAY
jgi:hypothetical protein